MAYAAVPVSSCSSGDEDPSKEPPPLDADTEANADGSGVGKDVGRGSGSAGTSACRGRRRRTSGALLFAFGGEGYLRRAPGEERSSGRESMGLGAGGEG